MDFVSIRVITADLQRLVGFYEHLTGEKARWFTEDFAELVTPRATLAIAHERTVKALAGAARAAANGSVIIEWKVDDVDATFDRVRAGLPDVLLPPTTMPWGNRSLLFRDPDGNLVNVFAPVTDAAKQRSARP